MGAGTAADEASGESESDPVSQNTPEAPEDGGIESTPDNEDTTTGDDATDASSELKDHEQ